MRSNKYAVINILICSNASQVNWSFFWGFLDILLKVWLHLKDVLDFIRIHSFLLPPLYLLICSFVCSFVTLSLYDTTITWRTSVLQLIYFTVCSNKRAIKVPYSLSLSPPPLIFSSSLSLTLSLFLPVCVYEGRLKKINENHNKVKSHKINKQPNEYHSLRMPWRAPRRTLCFFVSVKTQRGFGKMKSRIPQSGRLWVYLEGRAVCVYRELDQQRRLTGNGVFS